MYVHIVPESYRCRYGCTSLCSTLSPFPRVLSVYISITTTTINLAGTTRIHPTVLGFLVGVVLVLVLLPDLASGGTDAWAKDKHIIYLPSTRVSVPVFYISLSVG